MLLLQAQFFSVALSSQPLNLFKLALVEAYYLVKEHFFSLLCSFLSPDFVLLFSPLPPGFLFFVALAIHLVELGKETLAGLLVSLSLALSLFFLFSHALSESRQFS